jgi:hypothetical protein
MQYMQYSLIYVMSPPKTHKHKLVGRVLPWDPSVRPHCRAVYSLTNFGALTLRLGEHVAVYVSFDFSTDRWWLEGEANSIYSC